MRARNRRNCVAAPKGLAVEFFTTETSLHVTKCDSRLLGAEVGNHVKESVAVHVLEVRPVAVGERCTAGAESQSGHIHIRDVEAVPAKEGHRENALGERIDGVRVAARFDVNEHQTITYCCAIDKILFTTQ